jgi:hypothetical protein
MAVGGIKRSRNAAAVAHLSLIPVPSSQFLA